MAPFADLQSGLRKLGTAGGEAGVNSPDWLRGVGIPNPGRVVDNCCQRRKEGVVQLRTDPLGLKREAKAEAEAIIRPWEDVACR